MKYLDEYRDGASAKALAEAIAAVARRDWALMEVCGGQTHSIVRYGIDRMLPANVELAPRPRLPGLRHPARDDRPRPCGRRAAGVIFCSFGDMLRVPGSRGDLLSLKARGADIRIVYSPLDALRLAEPIRTAASSSSRSASRRRRPPTRWPPRRRSGAGCATSAVLVSQVLVPPMLSSILQSPGNRVQAFLGPGHVCTVMGRASTGRSPRDTASRS
jgi:hydrogenase expression/formation protein HypD